MIVVIADDLTGAAEIGGTGLRYGLVPEIQTYFSSDTEADILVIDANTRSLTSENAILETQRILKQLKAFPIDLVYKKVDSVLRGHVLDELQVFLTILSKKSVLLVPANPSMGKVVLQGMYWVDGKLLHETGFSQDPENSIGSSNVLELLGTSKDIHTYVLSKRQAIPLNSIVIGEAACKEDLLSWASCLQDTLIPAGAAEFFAAILEQKKLKREPIKKRREVCFGENALFVCGSSSQQSREFVYEARNKGIIVCNMPSRLFYSDHVIEFLLQQWVDEAVAAFEKTHWVVTAIDQPVIHNYSLSKRLRGYMAKFVKKVLQRVTVNELLIEGGATASSIVRYLQWKQFIPVQEISPGFVRMQLEGRGDIYLSIKPGSYKWPDSIWEHRSNLG